MKIPAKSSIFLSIEGASQVFFNVGSFPKHAKNMLAKLHYFIQQKNLSKKDEKQFKLLINKIRACPNLSLKQRLEFDLHRNNLDL